MRMSTLLCTLLLCLPVQAALVQFDNRTDFVASGTDLFSESFEGFNNFTTTGFNLIGGVDTRLSGVTYLAPTFSTIIQGFDGVTSLNGHDPLTNVYTNGIFGPILGTIDNNNGPVNQFGFDLAFVNRLATTRTSNSDFTINLISNVTNYTIDVLSTSLVHVANGSVFFGFGFTNINEHFTSFAISPSTSGVSPTIDNVTLRTGEVAIVQAPQLDTGAVTEVPTPNTLAMVLIAISILCRRTFHFRK